MGRKGIEDDVDNALFGLVVGVSDKINDLLVFNAKTSARAFHENSSGLAGCINGDRDECVERNILAIWYGHEAAS